MDVARTAIRNGSRNVSIMYRGGLKNISVKELEVEYAKIDGVKL